MTEQSTNARGHLVQLVFGQMAGQVLASGVRLGLADLIGDAERPGTELAAATGTDAGALTRLLRALAALDIVTETSSGTFRLTDTGALLRTDRPDSVAAFVRMFSDPAMLAAWTELDDAVRTGDTTFDKIFGVGFFEHLSADLEMSALFNASMRQGTRMTAQVLPAHYDFGRFDTVADIGGGDGTLIAEILRAHPGLSGIIYDTAEGLAQAGATLAAAEVADRCATRTGDFFAAAPPGADLYLLKSVLHDWSDDRAATILGHCREVIPEHGRLLIVEPVLPPVVDGTLPPTMYLSDLNMLVNLGGRERTRADFEQLCERAGFTVTEVHPLPAPAVFSLIEATPS
jgi:O-methyltransferase domain